MTHQRWFCALCGNLTTREPRPDGRVLCAAHEAVALDEVPADPLLSLPMQADELANRLGGGEVKPTGLVPPPPSISAPKREATSPADGMERC